MDAIHPENPDSPAIDAPPRDRRGVSVYRYRPGRFRAVCTCGWSRRHRLLKASSCADAWEHAAESGCHVNNPLVIPAAMAGRLR